jgi:hypothetical protein
MAGGLMDISTMAQTIGPLSRNRQVIGIDLEGHGRTALRDTPLSHERMARMSPPSSRISTSQRPTSRAIRTAVTLQSAWPSSTRTRSAT